MALTFQVAVSECGGVNGASATGKGCTCTDVAGGAQGETLQGATACAEDLTMGCACFPGFTLD